MDLQFCSGSQENVAACHGTDKVSLLQQPSWAALSTLMATNCEAFDVSNHRISSFLDMCFSLHSIAYVSKASLNLDLLRQARVAS